MGIAAILFLSYRWLFYYIDDEKFLKMVDQHQNVGSHQGVWDGLDASGAPPANEMYIYELRAGKYRNFT